MIIVRLDGGLGNQMFQYAFGRELAERHGTELKLDIGVYSDPALNDPPRTYDLDIFNIQESFASEAEIVRFAKRTRLDIPDRLLNRLLGVKKGHIREPHFHFSNEAYNAPDNVYLSGYWQSEKYFRNVQPQLRREFTFRDPMSENAKAIYDQIVRTNSVCVHVRRTDYLTNPLNGLCGLDYYKKAEQLIRQKTHDPAYFVFSDDINWCRSNLEFEGDTVFVSHDFGPRKFRDDLRLMSACKDFIISNSSFSWWAVWLNTNKCKTVIAPNDWFRDKSLDTNYLIPEEWNRI